MDRVNGEHYWGHPRLFSLWMPELFGLCRQHALPVQHLSRRSRPKLWGLSLSCSLGFGWLMVLIHCCLKRILGKAHSACTLWFTLDSGLCVPTHFLYEEEYAKWTVTDGTYLSHAQEILTDSTCGDLKFPVFLQAQGCWIQSSQATGNSKLQVLGCP